MCSIWQAAAEEDEPVGRCTFEGFFQEPRVLGNCLFDPENDCVLNLNEFPREHMTEAEKEILDEYEMDKLRATVRHHHPPTHDAPNSAPI